MSADDIPQIKTALFRENSISFWRILTLVPFYGVIVVFLIIKPASQDVNESLLHAESYNNRLLTQASTIEKKSKIYTAQPVSIELPRLAINLNVQKGEYEPASQLWNLDNEQVFHVAFSAPLNNRRQQTFIYGHNIPEVLGNINKIKNDDTLIAHGENGDIFTYKYVDSQTVSPTNTTVLKPDAWKGLSIMSCSGNWNQNRTIYHFRLISIHVAKRMQS